MKHPSKQRRPGRISRPKVPSQPWKWVARRDPFSKKIARECKAFAHALAQFCYHISFEPEQAKRFRNNLKTGLPERDNRMDLGRASSWLAAAEGCCSWADGFKIRPTSHSEGKAAQAQRRMRRAVDSLREAVVAMEKAIKRREVMERLGNGRIARRSQGLGRF